MVELRSGPEVVESEAMAIVELRAVDPMAVVALIVDADLKSLPILS